jgi:hypothetical protein
MRAPLPQPYPLWIAACRTASATPLAFLVVAWWPAGDDTLTPLVVLQGGDHFPGAHQLLTDPEGTHYAYGDTPIEACDAASRAAQKAARREVSA